MQEIECKILEVNKKQVEKKLLALGAKKKFDGVIEGCLMDYPTRELHKKGMWLRIRGMGEKSFVTLKMHTKRHKIAKHKKKAKILTEIEFEVSDLKKMRKVLELIGMQESLYIKKHRTSYVLDGVHFELDKYLGKRKKAPLFMEIEARSISQIYKYAALLGFSKEKCLPWGGFEVLEHYNLK